MFSLRSVPRLRNESLSLSPGLRVDPHREGSPPVWPPPRRKTVGRLYTVVQGRVSRAAHHTVEELDVSAEALHAVADVSSARAVSLAKKRLGRAPAPPACPSVWHVGRPVRFAHFTVL